MSKIYANPFSWGQPVNGNSYLPRPIEQEQISTAIGNQIPIIISGRRGTGKTSMMRFILNKMPDPSLFLDLRFVVGLGDLHRELVQAVATAFPSVSETEAFKALRQMDQEESLSPIFKFLQATQIVLVWDEFHHILNSKGNFIEELTKNFGVKSGITHVFISHREDLLCEIFENTKDRPFKKMEHIVLQGLDEKAFNLFLTKGFRQMGLNDFDLANAVLSFTECLPQLTQNLAHSLAQLWLEGNTTRLLDRTINKMLREHNALFTSQWDNFGLNEKRLLLGLASGHSRPTELGFIAKFGLSATSTAHNTALKLLREGWVVNRDEGYYLYDPLFLKWLKNEEVRS